MLITSGSGMLQFNKISGTKHMVISSLMIMHLIQLKDWRWPIDHWVRPMIGNSKNSDSLRNQTIRETKEDSSVTFFALLNILSLMLLGHQPDGIKDGVLKFSVLWLDFHLHVDSFNGDLTPQKLNLSIDFYWLQARTLKEWVEGTEDIITLSPWEAQLWLRDYSKSQFNTIK